MKSNLIKITATALMLGSVGTLASAEKQYNSQQDDALLSCLQSRLLVNDPKVVKVAQDKAAITMNVTNNLSYPVTTIQMRYTVAARSSGQKLLTDPVSLTVPAIAPGTTAKVSTPFFGLPNVSASQVAAGVRVEDVADPSGNQMVKNYDIIGLGWSGKKSTMGCQ